MATGNTKLKELIQQRSPKNKLNISFTNLLALIATTAVDNIVVIPAEDDSDNCPMYFVWLQPLACMKFSTLSEDLTKVMVELY